MIHVELRLNAICVILKITAMSGAPVNPLRTSFSASTSIPGKLIPPRSA